MENLFNKNIVSIYKILNSKKIYYPDIAPFDPSYRYPEYSFDNLQEEENMVYNAVRESFKLLQMDFKNIGKKIWNPLGEIINTGETVFINPNFVIDHHVNGGSIFSIITHPAVIRAICDYVYIALNGEGKIIIGDSPDASCNFQNLSKITKLNSIKQLYAAQKKIEIEILDLRDVWRITKKFKFERVKLKGDPKGSLTINLGKKSAFIGRESKKFYGADFNREETIKHHSGEKQEYNLSKTVLDADTIISIPKMKTHRKVGVTLNIKGFVGININKNYLVHYTLGSLHNGGDQFPGTIKKKVRKIINIRRLLFDKYLSKRNKCSDFIYFVIANSYKMLMPLFRFWGYDYDVNKDIDNGDWYGNDTCWRMAIDLLKIAVYADKNGKISETPQRKIFSVIDGIISGENNGPLSPDKKETGFIISGFNPVSVDLVTTRLMDFDYHKIKYLLNALENEYFDFFIKNPHNIKIFSNMEINNNFYFDSSNKFSSFKPAPGWIGHIEKKG